MQHAIIMCGVFAAVFVCIQWSPVAAVPRQRAVGFAHTVHTQCPQTQSADDYVVAALSDADFANAVRRMKQVYR
jgi:hypothetical protein